MRNLAEKVGDDLELWRMTRSTATSFARNSEVDRKIVQLTPATKHLRDLESCPSHTDFFCYQERGEEGLFFGTSISVTDQSYYSLTCRWDVSTEFRIGEKTRNYSLPCHWDVSTKFRSCKNPWYYLMPCRKDISTMFIMGRHPRNYSLHGDVSTKFRIGTHPKYIS